MSFFVIIMDGTLNGMEVAGKIKGAKSKAKVFTTVLPYVLATVLFRIFSWTLLSSVLFELTLVPLVIAVSANLAVILCFPSKGTSSLLLGVEPISCALYSAFVPTASFRSTAPENQDSRGSVRRPSIEVLSTSAGRALRYLTVIGTCLIEVFVWGAFGLVQLGLLELSPLLRTGHLLLRHVCLISAMGLLPVPLLELHAHSTSLIARECEDGDAERDEQDLTQKKASKTNKWWIVVMAIIFLLSLCAGLSLLAVHFVRPQDQLAVGGKLG